MFSFFYVIFIYGGGLSAVRLSTTDPKINRELPTMIKHVQTILKINRTPGFYHIKYHEQYMPELFLTLPPLQNKRNDQLLMISLCFCKNTSKSQIKNPQMASVQFPGHLAWSQASVIFLFTILFGRVVEL